MNNQVIYPEMGQQVSEETQIEYKCSYSGGFYLTTDLELSGRGVKKAGNGENHKRNKKTYRVTEFAFEKIKAKYICTFIDSL